MKLQALVPLVTYPDPNSDSIAANAVAVAKWIGADLHALGLNPDIPSPASPLSRLLLDVPEMIREAESLSHKRSRHLLDILRQQAEVVGVDITTEEIATPLTHLNEGATMNARYHDISLLGWEAGNPGSRVTAEAILFGSGRPAVLLPELAGIGSLEQVAIAWDGSRVAARAVADAQPFLRQASRITVFTVLGEKPLDEKDPGERLAEGLRKRGLPAEAVPLRAEDCSVAETLQQSALERSCNLLVMGAYGHSRVRDFVLGGATAGVLNNLLMPVLLAH